MKDAPEALRASPTGARPAWDGPAPAGRTPPKRFALPPLGAPPAWDGPAPG